jgi:hypothetical protein
MLGSLGEAILAVATFFARTSRALRDCSFLHLITPFGLFVIINQVYFGLQVFTIMEFIPELFSLQV